MNLVKFFLQYLSYFCHNGSILVIPSEGYTCIHTFINALLFFYNLEFATIVYLEVDYVQYFENCQPI